MQILEVKNDMAKIAYNPTQNHLLQIGRAHV